MSLHVESIRAVAEFVKRLRTIQANYGGTGSLVRAFDAQGFQGAPLYGLLSAESYPADCAFGMSLFLDYLRSCKKQHINTVVNRGQPYYVYGDLTLEHQLANKIGEWLNAMQIICDGSILENDQSRLFVWLDRGTHKPRFAEGKVEQCWMGRCTLRDRTHEISRLDRDGSMLWICRQKVMGITETFRWHIEHGRICIAKGESTQLDWAADELYRAYYRILTEDCFKEALTPKVGKKVGIHGCWVEQKHAKGYQIIHEVTLDNRDDYVFVIGYPTNVRCREIATITEVQRSNARHRDQFNYTITLHAGTVLSGMDWYIHQPEQYVTASTIQCCMCGHISPKAFDIKYVRGFGPVCGPSRDHYSDQGLICEADYD